MNTVFVSHLPLKWGRKIVKYMKIIKYPQSCVLIETHNKRILIDPGYLQYDDSVLESHWHDIDIILISHKHTDHCHVEAILQIIKNPKTRLYTIQEVKNAYPELQAEIVKEGDMLNLDDLKIEVVKSVHGYIPTFRGEKEIYENVGFIIDDGKQKVYFVGDSTCFLNDYKCDIIIIPICNHGLVMGIFEAALFAKETQAKLVIPAHYDSPKYPVDFQRAEEEFNKHKLNYKFLDIKESIEI